MIDKKLIIANWKNHPDTLDQAEEILEFTNDYLESLSEKKELSLIFCPPFIFLEDVARILKTSHLEHEASLGAQDIATENVTLTGEISGPMLSNLGTRYVIVGHSERRWKLGESDEVVNKKLKAVLQNGMVPLVCIGERVQDGNFKKFLENQINKTFEGLTADEVRRCIIVYEPVWAISTTPGAKPDTPASALQSIKIIKDLLTLNFKLLNLTFLYGGSVNSSNVGDFLKEKEINGVLVGGASVDKEEFVKILKVVSAISI